MQSLAVGEYKALKSFVKALKSWRGKALSAVGCPHICPRSEQKIWLRIS